MDIISIICCKVFTTYSGWATPDFISLVCSEMHKVNKRTQAGVGSLKSAGASTVRALMNILDISDQSKDIRVGLNTKSLW